MAHQDTRNRAGVDTGTVVFNVGGKHYEVLRNTIEARPNTLLATLLDDISTDVARPIFVDANPDRFAHILDWYRYGEIHLPTGHPVKSILNDARFFLLPDSVQIDGGLHELRAAAHEDDFRGAATAAVLDRWPTFERYVEGLIAEMRENMEDKLRLLSERAASEQQRFWDGRPCNVNTEMHWVLGEFMMEQKRYVWTDPRNVCSQERTQVLAAELEKRGFTCEVARSGNRMSLKVGLGDGKLWDNSAVKVKRGSSGR